MCNRSWTCPRTGEGPRWECLMSRGMLDRGARVFSSATCPLYPPILTPLPPLQVVEWTQALSPAMRAMQGAITEVLEALIKDLKRTNKIDW